MKSRSPNDGTAVVCGGRAWSIALRRRPKRYSMLHKMPRAASALLLMSALADFVNAERPNVVLILVDDLGYHDLGCNGHPQIKTPVLDRLANEGIRLTSFYSGATVCTPSRMALADGRLSNPRRLDKRRRRLHDQHAAGSGSRSIDHGQGLSGKRLSDWDRRKVAPRRPAAIPATFARIRFGLLYQQEQ